MARIVVVAVDHQPVVRVVRSIEQALGRGIGGQRRGRGDGKADRRQRGENHSPRHRSPPRFMAELRLVQARICCRARQDRLSGGAVRGGRPGDVHARIGPVSHRAVNAGLVSRPSECVARAPSRDPGEKRRPYARLQIVLRVSCAGPTQVGFARLAQYVPISGRPETRFSSRFAPRARNTIQCRRSFTPPAPCAPSR